MSAYRVLIIDDDKMMRNSLVDLLEAAGWTAKALARANDVERWISQFQPDVILSDVRMPGKTGMELVEELKSAPPIVLISAHGDIPMAVEAMNLGAYSFLEKSYEPKRLLLVLSHAAEQHQMRKSNQRLKNRLAELSGLNRVILGQTPEMLRLRDLVTMVAVSETAVLIHGETGTGKDLTARALHDLSSRCDGPYIAVNAAQLTAEQLPLLARNASDGTLFLDEICACPPDIQPMLLRLIEANEIIDPSRGEPDMIDLRVVSATNEDPELAATEGRLRPDLLFRLDGFRLQLPPLRNRLDDVAMLATRFMQELSSTYSITPPELTDEDLASLIAYDWPGNIRELKSVVERRMLFASKGIGSMKEALTRTDGVELPRPGLRQAVASFERQIIGKALKEHEGRMDEVAKILGIGRRTLNEKIVKLGLDKEAFL